MPDSRLPDLIARHEADLLAQWAKALSAAGATREDLMKPEELRAQCADLLGSVRQALQRGGNDITGQGWEKVRELLTEISRTRAQQGFTPTATASFVFSLKEPLFQRLRSEHAANPALLVEETWSTTTLVDKLGLFTIESYIKAREDIIRRQQEAMLELSTPVVKLWDGILALPLIGTLDSARTQIVMESLLQRVVTESTDVVILDITGVPTVDTLVAQHLLKTVTAARLMGTDCIISGIRPQIAQTIVHLGVDLTSVITKSSLADAFKVALSRRDLMVVKRKAAAAGAQA
ncbi:MAG: STAS domain-containing protein [Planctomycetes bacterium]|nr:STAS domain-containing protein [Planctomycetota bacterium]